MKKKRGIEPDEAKRCMLHPTVSVSDALYGNIPLGLFHIIFFFFIYSSIPILLFTTIQTLPYGEISLLSCVGSYGCLN